MVSMFFESAIRNEYVTLSFGSVTGGYFEALGTPLADGRRFDAVDDLAEVSPVMLSETAARFVYPNQDPVGRPMIYDFDVLGIARGDSPVVAIVGDVEHRGLDALRAGSMYVPVAACADRGIAHLVVRDHRRSGGAGSGGSRPHPHLEPVAADSGGAHARGTRRRHDRRAAAARRAGGRLRGAGAGGRHGRSPRHPGPERRGTAPGAGRTRAVGASPGTLVRLVMGSSLGVTPAGLVVGTTMAAATGRSLAGLLYGVGPYDAPRVATVAVVVALAALPASTIPARRAARLDPMTALRADSDVMHATETGLPRREVTTLMFDQVRHGRRHAGG